MRFSEVKAVMVTAAATIYCANEAVRLFQTVLERQAMKYAEQLAAMHDETQKYIETDFEMWWSSGPLKNLRHALLKRSLNDTEINLLPDDEKQSRTEEAARECRNVALHLAVHARMKPIETEFLNKIPRHVGKSLREIDVEHQKKLAELRKLLLDVGVNVIELEEHFAPTT